MIGIICLSKNNLTASVTVSHSPCFPKDSYNLYLSYAHLTIHSINSYLTNALSGFIRNDFATPVVE